MARCLWMQGPLHSWGPLTGGGSICCRAGSQKSEKSSLGVAVEELEKLLDAGSAYECCWGPKE